MNFFITELQLQNVILIGHSLGADVILETAVRTPAPIIGFIVIDYFKNLGTALPKDVIDQTVAGLKQDFKATVEAYVRSALVTPRTENTMVKKIVDDYRSMDPKSGSESIKDIFDYFQREKELAGQLSLKAHLLNVNYFPTNPEPLKLLKSGFTLDQIQGTCHYPMVEDPSGFNAALDKIIGEIANTKS